MKRRHGTCAALLNPLAAEPLMWPSPLKFISVLDPDAKALLEAALMEANRKRDKSILRGTKYSLSHTHSDDGADDANSEMNNNEGMTTLLQNICNYTRRVYHAVYLANQATDPTERNRHLVKVGWFFVASGSLCLVTVSCFIKKQEFSGDLTDLKAIILGFVTVAGFTGVVTGTIMHMVNNPGRFLHLTNFVLGVVTLGAAIAVGFMLAMAL